MSNKKDIVKKRKGEVIREARISEKNQESGKRNSIVVILLMGMIILIVFFFFLHWNLDSGDLGSTRKTAKDFKEEYETLNQKKDKDGNTYLELSIESDNVIQYVMYDKIFSLLERGTGIIYFGTPKSNQCRELLPILFDASDEVGIDTVYYLDLSNDRDQKKMGEDGKIITEKEGTKNYYKLLEKLDSIVKSYDGLENGDIKRIYFPTLIFIKDGEIIANYMGSSSPNTNTTMSQEESKKLKEELIGYMNQIITCDDAC